jgi:hypothetical protein
MNIDEYKLLISDFLLKKIIIEDFQSKFLNKFKNETGKLSEYQYELLDTLFGQVDSFTLDSDLIKQNPEFYINESQLYAYATDCLRGLA